MAGKTPKKSTANKPRDRQAKDFKNKAASYSKKPLSLRDALERLYRSTGPDLISPDPLELVVGYSDPADQEVAGLLASSWAYGRVETILDHVGEGLERMGNEPRKFVEHAASTPRHYGELSVFSDLGHRLHRSGDWGALCLFAGELVLEYGSLKRAFSIIWENTDHDLQKSLSVFAQKFHRAGYPSRMADIPSIRFGETHHLLADASKGSAAKRLNLWLRWMVRKDRVDPGTWNPDPGAELPVPCPVPRPVPRPVPCPVPRPADLVLPLDTHTTRLSRYLGFTRRKSPSWAAAREITDALKKFDEKDPVKYDFALCRLGILEICPSAKPPPNCRPCPIQPWCLRGRSPHPG